VDGIQAAAERGTEPLPTPDPARVAEIRRAIAAFQSNLEAAVSRRERLVNGAWFRYGEEMGRGDDELLVAAAAARRDQGVAGAWAEFSATMAATWEEWYRVVPEARDHPEGILPP